MFRDMNLTNPDTTVPLPKKLRDTSERFFFPWCCLIFLIIVCWFANISFCGHSLSKYLLRFGVLGLFTRSKYRTSISVFGCLFSGLVPEWRHQFGSEPRVVSPGLSEVLLTSKSYVTVIVEPRLMVSLEADGHPSMYTCLLQLDDSNLVGNHQTSIKQIVVWSSRR